LQKGEIRFGERLPNPFGGGEMTLWFHPLCAAFKRPEPMLEALAAIPDVADREALERAARSSMARRRLARIDGADRAKTSQAHCRHCRETIEKESWRIKLVYFEEGQFASSGFVHLKCAPAFFETRDIAQHVLHFSPDLGDAGRAGLEAAIRQL
jgi:hypothetical protein